MNLIWVKLSTMKTLIITAHPSPRGFTHKLAQVYQAQKKEAGGEAEIIDLYQTKHQQPFYGFEDKKKKKTKSLSAAQDYFHKKIAQTDEIVFIYPVWWGGMPAILKNWLDTNLTSGFAFKYVEGKPVGLLKRKRVKIFATAGGSTFLYILSGLALSMKHVWRLNVIKFCGMRLTEFKVFGNFDTKNRDEKNALEYVQQSAEQ
jgi:NAD(P)H dehydrogenase (quinone)